MTKAAASTAQVVSMPKIVRTSAGLRDALFDEIDRIRAGETDAKKANAVARLAGEIVNTVHMEMEVQKHLSSVPEEKRSQPTRLLKPVELAGE